jgi:N-glycosylase/DNA lyase
MKVRLPDDVAMAYQTNREAIVQRLTEFSEVPREQWFYEFCFCLCTPQSKAEHAMIAVEHLAEARFFEVGSDPTYVLANKDAYIRFHNVKSRRLLALRDQWPELMRDMALLHDARELRDLLVQRVNGYGLKEASHVLRNIGFRDLAILDRHILRMLAYCRVIDDCQKLSTRTDYLEVERLAIRYATDVGISLDELDLLFWFMNTGKILK